MSNSMKDSTNNYNENIRFSNKYNKKESNQIINWSEQIVALALSHINSFSKSSDKKALRQQRSYEKMKLNVSHENRIHLNKSISAESIMIPHKQIPMNEPFVIAGQMSKNGSYDTISGDSQSVTASEMSTSTSSDSLSNGSSSCSYGYGSLFDISQPQKRDNTRAIQRFGNGFRDKCLFPLVLPLDAYDLNKGKLTWDGILIKSDLELNNWENCSQSSRNINRVFGSPTDFVCPDSSLENKFLLHTRAHKPMKRWNSYEDLQNLFSEQKSVKSSFAAKTSVLTDETLFTREEFKLYDKEPNNKVEMESSLRKMSDDCYELKRFKSYSSLDFESVKNEKYNAKTFMSSIKVNSPIALAIELTKIDKECFRKLKSSQIFRCIIGGYDLNQNNDLTELNVLLEFGQQLNQLIISVIRKEITPETQGKKIAGFIEAACILRKLRNWHSLCNIIRSLQSPKIYFMEEAWMLLKRCYPIHYNDYLKLCRLVRTCETCIIGTTRPCIPSIISLVSSLRIHCIATWDLLESKRRWTEQPSIAGWLDNELIGQLVESQKLREKQEENYILRLDANQCSLLPVNDPIRFIHSSSLPINWNKKDIKFIPYSHLKQVVKCFTSSFKNEINSIQQYCIPIYQS